MGENYSKKVLILVFFVICWQAWLLKDYQIIYLGSNGEEKTSQTIGYLLGISFNLRLNDLAIFIFYYFFIILFFMQSYSALLDNWRIYYVIRNKSRMRVLIGILVKNLCLILLFSIVQLCINYMISSNHTVSELFIESNMQLVKQFFMYVFTFYNLILLYGVICYWKNKETAMIFSMSWLIISIIGSSTLIDMQPSLANITYIFFPNFLMATRFSTEHPFSFGFHYEWALVVNLMYAIGFLVVLIQLIKKRDII